MKLFLLLWMIAPMVFAQDAMTLEEGISATSLAPFCDVIEDKKKTVDLDEVIRNQKTLSKPWNKKSSINFGLKDLHVWVICKLENPTTRTLPIYIESSYAHNDHLTVFRIQSKQVVESYSAGDRQAFSQRQVKHRYPSFYFEFAPGEHQLIFHLNTAGVKRIPLRLWSPEEFMQHRAYEYGVIGIVGGSLCVMFVYNLFVFFVFRSRAYLHYTLYVGTYLTYFLSVQGISQELFSPNSTVNWLSDKGTVLMINTSGIFACLFSLYFLEVKKHFKLGYWLINLTILFYSLNFINIFFLDYRLATKAVFLIMMVMSFSMPLTGLYIAIKGERYATYFTIGWGCLLGGTVVQIGMQMGILEESPIAYWSQSIGAWLELVIFSFALGEKVNFIQQEKNKAVNKHLAAQKVITREVNDKLHSYKQLEKVFYPHQLEAIKTGKHLEETMPVGHGEATVISLDIIGSSSISSEVAKDKFQQIFARCSEIMMEQYNIDTMQSRGFRVKEMGDGFLCSVGFPFKCPNGQDSEVVALDLAKEFVAIIKVVSHEYFNGQRLKVAVGIADGGIEGFFPLAPPSQYDLYGESVVLATRYEQLRKKLVGIIPRYDSIIIIQEKVYDSLEGRQQQGFQPIDLSEEKIMIRNDPNAKKVYYLLT